MNSTATDIIQGIPRSRRSETVVAIIVGVVIVDFIAKRYGSPALRQYLAYPEPIEAMRRFKRVMSVFGLSVLPLVGYIGMMAGKIIRSRQLPYPGMSVWRDTRIARGRPALIRAWGLVDAAIGRTGCLCGPLSV